MFRVRLGQYPTWAKNAIEEGVPVEIYKIYQRWADAIVIRDLEVIIIEAKIKPEPGVISQINLYAQLFPKTPQFSSLVHLPIRKVILMAMKDQEIEELALDAGIEIEYYSPPWVTEYLKEIHKYRGRD